MGLPRADGISLDVGVSSHQLDTPQRGFSYHHDASLDMRMSQEGMSAKDLVNTLSWQELAQIISRYGEDKNAKSIAKGIVKAREEAFPVETTLQLAEIVKVSVPATVRRRTGSALLGKPSRALRIAVNGELDQLSKGLDAAFSLLRPGGRLAIITFHSLEDRMVKQRMNEWGTGCICPPDFPVCVCGNQPKAQLVYKKGLAPTSRSWSRILPAAAETHGYVSARSFSRSRVGDLNKFFSEQMHGSVTRCYNKIVRKLMIFLALPPNIKRGKHRSSKLASR